MAGAALHASKDADKALEHARRSADALVQQVETAQATAERQLRPYVALFEPRLERDFGGEDATKAVYKSSFGFKNAGLTPALDFQWRYERFIYAVKSTDDDFPFHLLQKDEWADWGVLERDGFGIHNEIFSVDRSRLRRVFSGDDAHICLIEWKYRDVFGADHFGQAALVQSPYGTEWSALNLREHRKLVRSDDDPA